MKVLGHTDWHPVLDGVVPTEPEFSPKVLLSCTIALKGILCASGFASYYEMNTSFQLEEATKIGFVALLLIMQLECAVPYLSVSGKGWRAGF